MFQPSMKAQLDGLEARKAALTASLAGADEPPPLLHPDMATLYRARVAALTRSLESGGGAGRGGGGAVLAISAIVLTPADGTLAVALRGDLAGILAVAANTKKPSAVDGLAAQFEMVAGARNHLKLLFEAAV
jgi:hypothetical protein